MIFVLSFNIVVYADAPKGKGTEEDPYMIYTVEDLRRVGSDEEWSLDKHYKLMNDIILEKPEDGKSNWTPIGGESGKSFTGTFDGNGKTITGMTITNAYGNAIGFFARLNGEKAMIEDLGLLDVKIAMDKYDQFKLSAVGVLVGVNSLGTIKNCYSIGNINVQSFMGGGLVGFNGGIVEYCYSKVNVNVGEKIYNNNSGGLIGYMDDFSNSTEYQSICQKSYAKGNVYGTVAGGLIGGMSGGIVTDCYNFGNVYGQQSAGGIVGNQVRGIIKNSYVTGNIVGKEVEVSSTKALSNSYDLYKDASGICPWPTGEIFNCVVLSPRIESYGGLVGYITCVENSINTAEYIKGCYILNDTVLLSGGKIKENLTYESMFRNRGELTDQLFYEEMGWKFTGEDAVWEFSGEYELPKLIGVGGQDDLITPEHLR